ncbi:MAG: YbbR-like domain-containing protein [Lachnospiraceae bacterium]
MKERLTNNLGLKLLSIFLAFFVWLLVVNLSNPETEDHREVPVEILNGDILEAAGQTYEIVGKSTVTVNYKIRTLDQHKVHSTDFKAYIDLADYYPVTGTVPVTIEVVNNEDAIISWSTKPQVMRIETEELQRKMFDLEVETTGTVAGGYAPGEIIIAPTYIYVKGPVSLVGQISKVGIEIDMTDRDSDFTGTAVPKFYDANGSEILQGDDRITTNYEEISYEVSVLKVKDVALDFEVGGEVASNYRFTGVESEVKTVSVEGLKSALASLSTITIPADVLNVEGAITDRKVTVDLSQYLPSGVKIAANSPSAIEVTLKVEQMETKLYSLEIDDIELTGENPSYQYEILPETLLLTVRGLGEDLESLDPATLHASIDVTGLQGGTHDGQLIFNLNEGFEVMEYSNFEVVISPKEGPDRVLQETEESGTESETTESETDVSGE